MADSMKARDWLLAFMLPIILLLGYFLYEQARTWTTPLPRWVVPSTGDDTGWCISPGRTGQESDAVPLVTFEAADATIDRIVARGYGFFPLESSPHLRQATLPDGQQRLAWYDCVLVDMPNWLEGRAVGIYIDALTGKPLMLVTDIYVGDPCMSGMCYLLKPPFSRAQFQCLVALCTYLVGLVAVGLGFGLRRLVGRKQSALDQ